MYVCTYVYGAVKFQLLRLFIFSGGFNSASTYMIVCMYICVKLLFMYKCMNKEMWVLEGIYIQKSI